MAQQRDSDNHVGAERLHDLVGAEGRQQHLAARLVVGGDGVHRGRQLELPEGKK